MQATQASMMTKLSIRIARNIRHAHDALQRASDGNEELGAHSSTLRYVSGQLDRVRDLAQVALDLIRDYDREFPDVDEPHPAECNCRTCCLSRDELHRPGGRRGSSPATSEARAIHETDSRQVDAELDR